MIYWEIVQETSREKLKRKGVILERKNTKQGCDVKQSPTKDIVSGVPKTTPRFDDSLGGFKGLSI